MSTDLSDRPVCRARKACTSLGCVGAIVSALVLGCGGPSPDDENAASDDSGASESGVDSSGESESGSVEPVPVTVYLTWVGCPDSVGIEVPECEDGYVLGEGCCFLPDDPDACVFPSYKRGWRVFATAEDGAEIESEVEPDVGECELAMELATGTWDLRADVIGDDAVYPCGPYQITSNNGYDSISIECG